MKYFPSFTNKRIQEGHVIFNERQKIYREKGLDFMKSREFILEKVGVMKGTILEIGAGRGITALAMAKSGYSLISIDNNEDMLMTTALNLAYEKLLKKVELHLMDAYSLQFEKNSFNNV